MSTDFGPGFATLSDDELDRLADYTAGVLSSADEAEVDRLVRDDPRWAQTHAALARADAAVRANLRAAAAGVSMPPDVAAQLDDALRAAARTGTASTGTGAEAAARTGATVVSIEAHRSKRRRLMLQVASAAAAIVAVVLGVNAVRHSTVTSSTTTAGGAAMSDRAPNAPTAALPGPSTIRSGRDYQPGTLGLLAQADAAGAPPADQESAKGAQSLQSAPDLNAAPAPLRRLAAPDALDACLAAIARSHPGQPRLVDYASFEGAPAILVLIQDGASETVVVVGDDCGLNGADERDVAVVG